MIKAKFITLLTASLLLTACNQNRVDFKEPKYAPLGNEVSFNDFHNTYETDLQKCDFLSSEPLGSKELTSKQYYEEEILLKNTKTKKEIKEYSNTGSAFNTLSYDSKKFILLNKAETKTANNGDDEVSNTTTVKTTKKETGTSYTKEGDKYIVFDFNNKTLEYEKRIDFTSEESAKNNIDTNAKMVCFVTIGTTFESYLHEYLPSNTPTGEELAPFHFYKNGGILTFTYANSEDVQNKNSDEEVISVENTKVNLKAQAQYSADKVTVKLHYEVVETTVYKMDSGNYRDGDVLTETTKGSMDMELVSKNVSLKSINLSKYAERG